MWNFYVNMDRRAVLWENLYVIFGTAALSLSKQYLRIHFLAQIKQCVSITKTSC
jgi:hypothetical protein